MGHSRVLAMVALAALANLGYGANPGGIAVPGTPAGRSVGDIVKDIQAMNAKILLVVGADDKMTDAAKRKERGPVAIPLYKNLMGFYLELAAADNSYADAATVSNARIAAILAGLNDADTVKQLNQMAQGSGNEALLAKLSLLGADWWTNSNDAAAQGKVLDRMAELAKANPKSDYVAQALMMEATTDAANEALSNRAEDLIVTTLTAPWLQR
jgi:hypothetical protein